MVIFYQNKKIHIVSLIRLFVARSCRDSSIVSHIKTFFWYVLCILEYSKVILKVYWADAPNKQIDSEEDVSARYFNNKRIGFTGSI